MIRVCLNVRYNHYNSGVLDPIGDNLDICVVYVVLAAADSTGNDITIQSHDLSSYYDNPNT